MLLKYKMADGYHFEKINKSSYLNNSLTHHHSFVMASFFSVSITQPLIYVNAELESIQHFYNAGVPTRGNSPKGEFLGNMGPYIGRLVLLEC